MKDFEIFGRLADAGRSLGAVGKGVAAPPITPGVTNPNATAVPACLALSSVA